MKSECKKKANEQSRFLNQSETILMYIKVEQSLSLVSVMSQLLNVLFAECTRVCARMSVLPTALRSADSSKIGLSSPQTRDKTCVSIDPPSCCVIV